MQQQDPPQRLEQRRRVVQRSDDRPARRDGREPGIRSGEDRPVLPVGGVHEERHARRRLLRPAVRQGRDDRVVGLLAVRQLESHEVRRQARHLVADAGPDAVRRPVRRPRSTGTTSAWLRQGITRCRSGPTRVPPSCSSAPGPPRQAFRRPSARESRARACRQTTRTRSWQRCRSRRSRRNRHMRSTWGRASGPTPLYGSAAAIARSVSSSSLTPDAAALSRS